MQLVTQLSEQGVRFVALDVGIDTETPAGRLMLTVFAALAEHERESIRERTQAGRELAKAQGKQMGRPDGADPVKLAKVKKCLDAGMSLRETATTTSVSLSSVQRYSKKLREGK